MKKIAHGFCLVTIILLFPLLCSCSNASGSEKKEHDVIGDLKDTVFEDYGHKKLGDAVDIVVSDAEWDFETAEDWLTYNATMSGDITESDHKIRLDFKIYYKIRRTANSPQEIETHVVSAAVDDKPYEDLDAVMKWIYGITPKLDLNVPGAWKKEPENIQYITLKELNDAYDANELVAEQTYNDQFFYVRGTVDEIYSSGYVNLVSITEENSGYSASFEFDLSDQTPYNLKKGDRVVLGGRLSFFAIRFSDAWLYCIEDSENTSINDGIGDSEDTTIDDSIDYGVDTVIESNYYTITIPAKLADRFVCEESEAGMRALGDLEFYEYDGMYGIFSFSICIVPDDVDDDALTATVCHKLGALLEVTDIRPNPLFIGYVAVYSVSGELDDDVLSILDSFTAKDGYAFIAS